MNKIFLVQADYGYEGQAAVRAFATPEEADAFLTEVRAYHATRPTDYRAPDYGARRKAWEDKHPASHNTACYGFEVEEVPFGLPIES